MSAWEGSAWQLNEELRKARLKQVIDRIQQENPWLSNADCTEYALKLEKEAQEKAPKCCPCSGRSAGIVRSGSHLGPCECRCHREAMR